MSFCSKVSFFQNVLKKNRDGLFLVAFVLNFSHPPMTVSPLDKCLKDISYNVLRFLSRGYCYKTKCGPQGKSEYLHAGSLHFQLIYCVLGCCRRVAGSKI